jgi:hypothetical protein
MAVVPGDFEGATSRVLRAPRRFDVLGVRGPDAARGRFEVRVRRHGGAWSPWVALAVHGDHAPDTGTGERASDPIWAGGCDELQLRSSRPLRGALRVHFVSVPAVGRRSPVARAAASPKQQAAPGTPPAIIPRAAWGAAAVPPRAAPDYGVVQMAFVHHTVTANDYTPDQSASMVLAIAKYHRDTNGWNDIGYNFLVDQYGQVFEGRAGGVEQAVIGAQAQGYNSQSTGVAVLGTFTGVPIPEDGDGGHHAAARVEAHAAWCPVRGRADDHLRRRQPEPLLLGDAGGPAADLRSSRRRQHRMPRRRSLRPAARAAPARVSSGRPDRDPRRDQPAASADAIDYGADAVFKARSSAPTPPPAPARSSRCRSAGAPARGSRSPAPQR